MRQVPRYLIIGNGRLARHFQHYFRLLNLSFLSWHRQQPDSLLNEYLNQSTHALLMISDQAIDTFIANHLQNDVIKIHFSGSHVTDHAFGVHPLMTFNNDLYPLQHYQAIPFVIDHDAPDFTALFPQLTNIHVRLDKSLKSKYHAMCVLSGNFSCMLWQKLLMVLENEFNIPKEIAFPYLQQQTNNLMMNYKDALTGPLVRNDLVTIQNNLKTLEQDPFKNVYESFVNCYNQQKQESE